MAKSAPVPVIHFNAQRAEDAFKAHAAMLKMEAANPELGDNPAWTVLRQDAFENFALAFEGLQ